MGTRRSGGVGWPGVGYAGVPAESTPSAALLHGMRESTAAVSEAVHIAESAGDVLTSISAQRNFGHYLRQVEEWNEAVKVLSGVLDAARAHRMRRVRPGSPERAREGAEKGRS